MLVLHVRHGRFTREEKEGEAAAMNTITYSPSHPILFIFDFSNESMEVPAYDPEAVASSNNGCVAVRTIADVDGDVTVTFAETLQMEATQHAVEVFCGVIDAPTRKVAVVTSENEILLERRVATSKPSIRVLVDDEQFPQNIWVQAQ